jgi:hypothetical protein
MNYEIMVGEPWDFQGSDGDNKILVSGIGIVHVIDHENHEWESYLLQVLHPFVMDKQKVEFMVFQPRYTGDTIYEIAKIGGMVGVYRVKEGMSVQKEQRISVDDLTYCVIGHLNIISE